MTIRVLIADDHAVIRDGVAAMLAPQEDFDVVGTAADGDEAVALTRLLRPDVVLMDLRMPGMDGVAATARIASATGAPRVLVLTTYDSDSDILRAMGAGALGYLLKDTPRQELFAAIRAAARGQAALTPSVATRLVRHHRTPTPDALSERERQVLNLAAQGEGNRQIANRLNVSEATVKTYFARVFAKLSVADRTAAVTTAPKLGLIQLE
jgi:DNA-binding NarL/FixJ family response regulator